MKFYNLMFDGWHILAPLWLGILKLNPDVINRFRDAYLIMDGASYRIYILTRSADNPELLAHPKALANRPSNIDPTYHEFEFEMPESITEHVVRLKDLIVQQRFTERFRDLIRDIEEKREATREGWSTGTRPITFNDLTAFQAPYDAMMEQLEKDGFIRKVEGGYLVIHDNKKG